MSITTKRPTISRDTPIIPRIAAETVVEHAVALTGAPISSCYVARLVTRANATYSANPYFRRRLRARGDLGRDRLHSYMQHWLSSYLHKEHPAVYDRLPRAFITGRG